MRSLTEDLEECKKKETELQIQLRESRRVFTDLEGKLKEDLMMARIRDTENAQCVAELTQKISNLEFKVKIPIFKTDSNFWYMCSLY